MKAAIFDLDGTLIDSMTMWRNLGKNFLEKRNIEMTEKIANDMTTMSLKMSSAYLKNIVGLNGTIDDIYQEFKDIIMNFYLNEVKEKEKAFETLKNYKEKGYAVVLGTATSDEFVEPLLERFNIKKYFDLVQTCDMVNIKKNDKEYFNKIAQKLEISPQEIFLFDDAPFALEAAREAGIITVGVYDHESREYWDRIVAENKYAIKSFSEWRV